MLKAFIQSLKTKEQRYALAIFLSALLPMGIHLLIYTVDGGNLMRLDRCLDLNQKCYYAFSQTIFLINAATLAISLLGIWWAHRWHHYYRAARQWLSDGDVVVSPILAQPPFSYEGDIFAVEKMGDSSERLIRWNGTAWTKSNSPWSILWDAGEVSPEALAKAGISI